MTWFSTNWQWIALSVVALDNTLAQVPVIAANSTFQLLSGVLKSVLGIFAPPAPPTPPTAPKV